MRRLLERRRRAVVGSATQLRDREGEWDGVSAGDRYLPNDGCRAEQIAQAAAFLDCRLAATHAAGDHLIFVGEVVGIGQEPDVRPLLFHGDRYRSVTDD